MADLLARFAENCFWLARYMERAENLARILDVNEAFARRERGGEDWLPIVELHSDEERFYALHKKATTDSVVHFYVLDGDNPSSIISSVRMARENARSLRHLISTEMWTHLNVFCNFLQGLRRRDIALANLSRLCVTIKENCQTHEGITEGTFYRDQAWCFYFIGKYLERADQTSRLLDIRYHRLMRSEWEIGSPADVSEWNALLRSVAGYHAFRRTHPRGMRPADVAEFLIFNRYFPRAIATCVQGTSEIMRRLEEREDVAAEDGPGGAIRDLRRELESWTIDDVMRDGLHESMDWVQCRLIDLTKEMGRTFFGRNA